MRRILIYRTGETHPEIVRDVGNYMEWFARVVGDRAVLEPHDAVLEPVPGRGALEGIDGMVVTGSPLSLVEPEAWMEDAAAFVDEAAGRGVPILGICFGHQLVGHAFGGRVRQNPRGWEAGTHEVALTDHGRRDPLFHGLPERVRVIQSHRDEVVELGSTTVRLAGGEHSENQAIGVGCHVRGVQFHPEMNGSIIRRVIEHRRTLLTVDAHRTGRGPTAHAEALLAGVTDTPDAEQVMRNFIDHFVAKA
jgi:GMP synthase (glutamine-hydrolysing)